MTGVAVAAVQFGLGGHPQAIEILESPDTDIGRAVRQALNGWRVPATQVLGQPEKSGVRGKLTFYVQFTDGQGRVLNPNRAASPPHAAAGHRLQRRIGQPQPGRLARFLSTRAGNPLWCSGVHPNEQQQRQESVPQSDTSQRPVWRGAPHPR